MANLDDPHEQYLARRARDSMQLDLRGIHDMQAKVLSNQRPYTYNHNAGPREVTLLNSRGDEMVDGLDNMNTTLSDAADLADINADIQAGISREIATELRWIREGTDTLPEIHGVLEHISAATFGELALQSIGIGLNIQSMVREGDYHKESMRGIQGMSEDIDEGLGEIVEEIQELRVEIGVGSEQIASTMIETSRAIIEAIGGGFWELGLLMVEIEERKSGELRALGGNIAHHFELLNREEERRHQELMSALNYFSANRLAIEAGQKYKSAAAQYKIGNFRIALKDIRAALELKSDHIPSLMLYGKIAAARTRWANAKDAFYSASQHALLQKDETAYQASIIELSRIERLVGNQKQGTKILQEAAEGEGKEIFKDEVLSHIEFELLRVRAPEIVKNMKAEGEAHDYFCKINGKIGFSPTPQREKENGAWLRKKLNEIIIKSPEYWKELREGSHFASLRKEMPYIVAGPFIRLIEITGEAFGGLNIHGKSREWPDAESDYDRDIIAVHQRAWNIISIMDMNKVAASPDVLKKINKFEAIILNEDKKIRERRMSMRNKNNRLEKPKIHIRTIESFQRRLDENIYPMLEELERIVPKLSK